MNGDAPELLAEERRVIRVCLGLLYVGRGQVVRSESRSGLGAPSEEARMLGFVQANLRGVREETLEDFARNNRQQHPIDPNLNPDGLLSCVGDQEFRHIFRDGEGWDRFRSAYPDSDGTLRISRFGFGVS